VDILFVVDGSPSMAQEADNLAEQMMVVAAVYDPPRGGIDYRLAVVDAQVPQPGCEVDVDAGGRFIDTSCRERLGDFVSGPNAEAESVDRRFVGCTQRCSHEALATESTVTLEDPTPRSRPWIESTYGITNLPEDRSVESDLLCRGPTGIGGCTFEAPLEAMRLALLRAEDPSDPAYGFLRPDAALFVLFITDEPDCSFGDDVAAISTLFDSDGPRTYWSDPTADQPTSGMCFHAGVECEGEPDALACFAVDKPVPGGDAPVLRPIDEYIEQLRAIEALKLRGMPQADRAVYVSVVGGVPVSGDNARFQLPADALEAARAGIGLGCESTWGHAYPPVRLAEVAAEFNEFERWGETSLTSICENFWLSALACVPGWDPWIEGGWCIAPCFLDTDPSTEEVDARCVVDWTDPEGQVHSLPSCEGSGWAATAPEGAVGCASLRELAPDQLSACEQENGRHLDIRIAEGVPHGCFNVTCEVETTPGICPRPPSWAW
jgi:hypothetical protein